MRAWRWLLTAILALAAALPARAQESYDIYEAQYGQPVDVTITDLVQGLGGYEGRAIRTRGRVDMDSSSRAGGSRQWVLRDGVSSSVLIVPVSQIAFEFDNAAMQLVGHDVQVVGLFQRFDATDVVGNAPAGLVQFWRFLDLQPRDEEGPLKAGDVSLEDLVLQPGKRDGQTIRVVGKFRGRNLYGDLPVRSQTDGDDWVIKDDLYAVWVTGKKPKGSGWQLDPTLKRDTGKWIEVIGRPETRGRLTYLHAIRVALTSAPTQTAEAQAPPPPPEKPISPPMVVFALPLDGEAEVARDSLFVVQFSKDMDERTFEGRVALRYRGPPQPGDREFVGLRLSYDSGRRALTVDPGDVLRPGRQLELLLMPGIADVDGLPLTSRPGRLLDGVVDVLRYQIGL
jgi:hypothetical protein